MKVGPDISHVAALIGDPARTNMLLALVSGDAWTAGDLAREAGVSPATASSHLSKLQAGGLIERSRRGRHRFYRLKDEDVGEALEVLLRIAVRTGHTRHVVAPAESSLRAARVCYDHLAGASGVRLYRFLRSSGHLVGDDRSIRLSPAGEDFIERFGVSLSALRERRRPLCRPCLDWSEQTHHLGGLLGAALLERMMALNWLARADGSRAVDFSATGERAFAEFMAAAPA